MYDLNENLRNPQYQNLDKIRDDWEYINDIADDCLYAIERVELGEYKGKPAAYYIRKFLDNARGWRTPYASEKKEHFRKILKYEGVWLWVKDVSDDEDFNFKVDIYITNPLVRKKPILLDCKMLKSLDYYYLLSDFGDFAETAMYYCRTFTPSASIIVDKGSAAETEIDKYVPKMEEIEKSGEGYSIFLPIMKLNLIKR